MPGGRTSICMGCGDTISDQYILRVAPDMEWHAACLKCAECQQFLDERCTCFVRDGKTFCKKDYARLFGAKCEKCDLGFTSSNMVMRAKNKIFHVHCFKCTLCQRKLQPGDEFALRNENLYCRLDYDALKDVIADEEIVDANHNTSSICPVQLAEEPELHSEEASSRPSTADSSQCRVSRDIRSPSDMTISVEKRSVGLSRKESGRIHKSEGKPTRVRTVLTEKQLHTLRTCYNANPRPDALMKEQLVEMTGLSPRVIRVWFQNKRCKDKKRAIFMKQSIMHPEKNGRYGLYGSMQGIPLVASSPTQQDPPGIPYDVTTIQPPWKSIAEFALSHEIDRLDPNTQQYQQFLQQMHGYGMDHDMSQNRIAHQSPLYNHMDDTGEDSCRIPIGLIRNSMASPFMQFPRAPSELSSTSSD